MKTRNFFGGIGLCVLLFSISLPLFASNPEEDCECRVPKPSQEKEKAHPSLINLPGPFYADIPSMGTTTSVEFGVQNTDGSKAYTFVGGSLLEKSSADPQPRFGIGVIFPLKHIKSASIKIAMGTQKVVGYVKNTGSNFAGKVTQFVKFIWFW